MSKKILHIQLLPILSGVQKVSLQLFSNLCDEDIDMWLLCAPQPDGRSDSLIEEAEKLGVNVHIEPFLKRNLNVGDLRVFYRLYKFIKAEKFDVVHTHSSKTGFLGRIAAKVAGVPQVIHTIHGYPFHPYQSPETRMFYKLLEKFAAGFADMNVFVNKYERQLALTEHLVGKKNSMTIFNGIDVPTNRAEGSPGDKINVVSICRFSRQKNILSTIRTAIKACHKTPDLDFTFVGNGELFDVCQGLVSKAGLTERIHLPGWSNNVEDYYLAADVFLLYSKWEGLPISILEAMSHGLPVIASDIKGNNELVTSDNGYLVDVMKPFELEQLLLQLPGKKKTLHFLGDKSLEKIRNDFSLYDFVSAYKELYLNG